MRTFILFLIILSGLVPVSIGLEAQEISLHLTEGTLEEILQKIRKKTNYDMVYPMEDIRNIRDRQTVRFRNQELQQILAHCLKAYPLDFRIYNRTIIIFRKQQDTLSVSRTISGLIEDEQGSPLSLASIRIGDYGFGTVSGTDGRFTFTLPTGELPVLTISYVGKKPYYLPVSEAQEYHIVLETQSEKMEDVIVNGYQNIPKNEMTGAVTTIRGENIRVAGVNSLEAGLQGMFNGLEVVLPSGNIGAAGQIRVRGTSTIVGNPEPLVVVDGMIRENIMPFDRNTLTDLLNNGELANAAQSSIMGNNLSGINADDIASITLLKDVSATAIYGIRASNGVIVINTKKGNSSRQQIAFRSDITFSPVPRYRSQRVMNSCQRIQLSKEFTEKGLPYQSIPSLGYEAAYLKMIDKQISYQEFKREVSRLETMNTDWFRVLGRTAVGQNYHLSLRSGKNGFLWYASAGFRKENSAFNGNDRKTCTALLNLDIRTSDKWQFSANISGADIRTSGYYPGINPEQYALKTSRYLEARQTYPIADRPFNILHELAHTGNTNHVSEIHLLGSFIWKVLPELALSFRPAWSQGINRNRLYADQYAWNAMEETGESPGHRDYDNVTRQSYTLKGQADFRKTAGITVSHSLSGTLGWEMRQNRYTGEARENNQLSLTDRVENILSMYGTIGYTYDSRYTFCLNLRNDASNRFGKNTNHRFYPVWSVGLRWDLSAERWFLRKSWINQFSLRTSLGRQGNVVSNVSPRVLVSSAGQNATTSENYLQLEQFANPDLKWEKTNSWNIGTQLSLFQSKLNISFDYFRKETRDIIVEKNIPIENGSRKMFLNSGAVSNRGYELAIDLVPLSFANREWTLGFTAAYTKNTMKNSQSDAPGLNDFTNGKAVIDNFPVSGFWSVPFTGLSSVNGMPQFAGIDQANGQMQKVTGSLLDYLLYSGSSTPELSGGLYSTLRYKNLSLTACFNYQLGHYKRLNPFISSQNGQLILPTADMNASAELLNRWQQTGDERYTDIPALTNQDENLSAYLPDNSLSREIGYGEIYRYTLYNRSTARVVSASHLRCNRITLSYKYPLSSRSHLLIALTANNPFIIKDKKLKGQDPETLSQNPDVYTPVMSRPKNYSVSIEINF